MNQLVEAENNSPSIINQNGTEQFLSMKVGEQLFGIAVIGIIDVLKPINITPIPLAKPEIIGLMNLRGRIVTVIDMRTRLDINYAAEPKKPMYVVVENENELFALLVDEVGEAQNLKLTEFEKTPENLASNLRKTSRGIFKFKDELMLVLDINSLVSF